MIAWNEKEDLFKNALSDFFGDLPGEISALPNDVQENLPSWENLRFILDSNQQSLNNTHRVTPVMLHLEGLKFDLSCIPEISSNDVVFDLLRFLNEIKQKEFYHFHYLPMDDQKENFDDQYQRFLSKLENVNKEMHAKFTSKDRKEQFTQVKTLFEEHPALLEKAELKKSYKQLSVSDLARHHFGDLFNTDLHDACMEYKRSAQSALPSVAPPTGAQVLKFLKEQ